MGVSAALSYWLLVVTAATLFWVALTDLRHFKIRNDLIIVLIVLFFVYAFLSGRWREIYLNIGLALLLLCIMLYYYSQKLMGGGDVKLFAVAFLVDRAVVRASLRPVSFDFHWAARGRREIRLGRGSSAGGQAQAHPLGAVDRRRAHRNDHDRLSEADDVERE